MGKLVGLLDALLCGLDGDKLIENCSTERVVRRCLTRHIPYQPHVIVFPRLAVSEKKIREISEAVGEMLLEKKKAAIYFEDEISSYKSNRTNNKREREREREVLQKSSLSLPNAD
ncbi:hypothetical protein T05_5716 [Trichinella murrelli]|uniref:Uncharacterized protein n=1 Tax=Trichinella murrelli TaxID=144512 RepID=A0A0V0TJ55_9BILA|nr:hypothetical protein T05_5716 [Trichinella murrelli]